MRAILMTALIFVTGFLIVMASKNYNYPRFLKHRTKLREIRGFKPEYISTAIGFGKREDPAKIPNLGKIEEILLSLLQTSLRAVSAELLLMKMQKYPALIDKLRQLSKQNNRGDEESMSVDHLKPERTITIS